MEGFLEKIIVPLVVILLLVQTLPAKETSWVGAGEKWDDLDNWSNGVPEVGDSAYITGNVQVTIFSNVSARARLLLISSGAILTVADGGELQIDGGGVDGLLIQDDHSALTVEGFTHVFNGGGIGLLARDSTIVTVEGFLLVEDCISFGIRLLSGAHLINNGEVQILNISNALSLSGSSFVNDGLLIVNFSLYAISLISKSSAINYDEINISHCGAEGLSIRHQGQIENFGEIIVDHVAYIGIRTYGKLINHGLINIDSTGDHVDIGTGFLVDSFACCDTVYLGEVINSGSIHIVHSEGDAIFLDHSTSFTCDGHLQITSSIQRGMVVKSRSSLILKMGGVITFGSIMQEPLVVEEEAILQIDSGGLVNIN